MSYLFDESKYEIWDKYFIRYEGETNKYFISVRGEHTEVPEEFYLKVKKGDWLIVKTYFDIGQRV